MSKKIHPENEGRAALAAEAFDIFAAVAGMEIEPKDTVLTDLLTNLMHLGDVYEVDFEAALATAKMHYEAELDDPIN